MFFRLLFPLIVILAPFSYAEDGFCLSGGFRNGYSCEVPLFSELDSRNTSFSIQLLERGDDRKLSELEQVVHVSELEGNKRLVYLGEYDSQASGMTALQKTLKDYGAAHYPMLVALTPSEKMPRIRLVAEPNVARPLAAIPATHSKVYAIQLAAFSSIQDAKQFSGQLPVSGLLCRRKNNGLYTVYYQKFEHLEQASSHLDDHSFIDNLGGYVVALNNVAFSVCEDLETNEGSSSTFIAETAREKNNTTPVDDRLSSHTKVTSEVITSLKSESELKPDFEFKATDDSEDSYDLIYTIQLAAFKQSSSAATFVKRHSKQPLLCRVKDNGMSAIYYGKYSSATQAHTHTADFPLIARQKGYVVKLRNVTFKACR